ncbi:MAG: hypothetical protein V4535_08370 [Bacteroidota bacterium]
MKTIILGAALLLTMSIQAQNQNKKTETKTTTTTVKDDKGVRQVVKNEEIKQVQDIELNDVPAGTKNTDIKPSAVQVTETTKVSVDGVERTIDVDHSAAYSSSGETYKLAADKSGYRVMNNTNNTVSLLRRTSNNSYIYKSGDKFSVGYFDANGNLVLETYDEKTDTISTQVYNLQK